MHRFCFSLLFFSLLALEAKVPIVISETMTPFIEDQQTLGRVLSILPEKNEASVVKAFIGEKAKLALIRSDMMKTLYQNRNITYHIIGRISERAVLYFASKDTKRSSIEKAFVHHRISIGMLGDKAGIYLKQILNQNDIAYCTNFISQDTYRSISALRRKDIDRVFLFASERDKKVFLHYLAPYPEGIKSVLKNIEGLYCEDDSYCYASYYLIASDDLGKGAMENIYTQIAPLLSKNKALSSKFGRYYIYTGLKREYLPNLKEKYQRKKVKVPINDKTQGPKFHRTPWMDIAIKEAMKGKGSAENVLPMLDLSYKYIRFAKGDQGITTAPNDNKEGSWCAAYVCWTLSKSGYKIHPKGRMASQSFRYFKNKLYRKIEKPIFGAITLYTSIKNPAHGHVGYLFGKTKNGRFILLGGNQSNRLKFADYPARFGSYKLRGFYVPIDYKIKFEDRLTDKDIYSSAQSLNRKYGINAGKRSNRVR